MSIHMRGRYAQLSRVLTILARLEGAPHGLTVSEMHDRLADEGFKVDKRTVYRDLQALESLAFLYPDESPGDEGGARWKIHRTMKVGRTLSLEMRELFALYVAKNVLLPLKETPLYTDLERVFKKIEATLGEKCRDYLGTLSSEVHFEPGPLWGLGIEPDVIDTVQAACEEGHIFSVTYETAHGDKKSERRLGPHFLYFAKGSLYLVAEDLGDHAVKIFAVPRMSNAIMMEDAYTCERVDPEKFFASSFGIFRGEQVERIKLEFRPPVAAGVRERRWHQSQRIVLQNNGLVQMRLDVAITPELMQWILSFGDAVRVLEPKRLIVELTSHAHAIIELYEKNKAA
ncbi:MAG: WYL domain-containing protein [Bdellovibrionota bacterium]